jgi:hypothetical protein
MRGFVDALTRGLAFFLDFFDLFFSVGVFDKEAIAGVAETIGAGVFGGVAETIGRVTAVFAGVADTMGAGVFGGVAETIGGVAAVFEGFFGTVAFWGEIFAGVMGTSGVNPSSTPA